MWCKSCCLQAKRSQTPMVQTPLHPNFPTQTVLASFECFGSQKMLAPGAIMWKSFTRILPQPDTRFPTCNCFSIWLQKPQVLTPQTLQLFLHMFCQNCESLQPKVWSQEPTPATLHASSPLLHATTTKQDVSSCSCTVTYLLFDSHSLRAKSAVESRFLV